MKLSIDLENKTISIGYQLKNAICIETNDMLFLNAVKKIKQKISGVNNVNSINEKTFSIFYDQLYEKAKRYNEMEYQYYIRKNKSKNKKYHFVSEWQKIFNAWLEGKIMHSLIVSVVEQDNVIDGMSDDLIEQTNKFIDERFWNTIKDLSTDDILVKINS